MENNPKLPYYELVTQIDSFLKNIPLDSLEDQIVKQTLIGLFKQYFEAKVIYLNSSQIKKASYPEILEDQKQLYILLEDWRWITEKETENGLPSPADLEYWSKFTLVEAALKELCSTNGIQYKRPF